MKKSEPVDMVGADGRVVHTMTDKADAWRKKGYRIEGEEAPPVVKRKRGRESLADPED